MTLPTHIDAFADELERRHDPYGWWRRALAGGKIGGPDLPVSDGAPQIGFYRRRMFRGGPFVPVAIFEHEGRTVATTDGVESDPDETWLYCAKHPITEECYRHRVDTGEWPDVAPEVGSVIAPAAPIGATTPPVDADSFKARVEKSALGVANYEKIEDDATAAKAQTLRSHLLELSRGADTLRKDEKAPHLKAGKDIDALWQPIVKAAKEAAGTIQKALSRYETQKAQAHADARVNKPLPTQIKGGSGRAATVKAVRVITEITDIDALFAHYREDEQVQSYLRNRAQRDVGVGHDVPGVKIEEQRKVA